MIFEGSEKKVELVVSEDVPSLRSMGREFWAGIVEKAEAKILSSISSEACDAYLLSESSLFVWDSYFTMITCGRTTLINAVGAFADHVGRDKIQSLIFERKNEYFPRHQKTDFYEDARQLNAHFPGKAFRFGQADDHHLFIYHLGKDYAPSSDDCTLEILMYDLQGAGKEVFACENQTVASIREKAGVHCLFEGFEVDDFAFDPCGYSLNALNGKDYYTIHVTPEEQGSYVSFETNYNLSGSIESTLNRVLEVFQPNAFDVIVFRPKNQAWQDHAVTVCGYNKKTTVKQTLQCGYDVSYTYHYKKIEDIQEAMPLEDF